MATSAPARVHRIRGARVGAVRAADPLFALLAAALFVGVWYLASTRLGESSIPGPGETIRALFDLTRSGELWTATGQTLASTAVGLGICALTMVPLGILIGINDFATRSSHFTIDFLASVPPVSFLPLTLLLFGPEFPMKIALIVYGASWPLLVRTIYAVRDLEPVLHQVGQAFDLRTRRRWINMYIPAALPGVLVGLRVSATFALLLSVTSEYIGGAAGIGRELVQAQQNVRPDQAMAFAVVAGILGISLNLVMNATTRLVIPWHPSARERSVR